MKFLSLLCLLFLISIVSFSQVPKRIAYQAVIRNSSNALVVSSPVKVRFTILSGSITGTVVYSEVHSDTTNQNGLVTLQIGGGTVLSGNFSTIQWSTGSYYIKAETDPTGGNNFTIVTTAQLLTVPYAFYADSASNGMLKGTAQGQMLYWDGSKWVLLSPGQNGQYLKWCNGVPTWDACTPIVETIGFDAPGGDPTIATCNIRIISEGGSYITQGGVCYSLNQNPTISDNILSIGGANNPVGVYVLDIHNLLPNTTYYARAFATNSVGTSYGNQVAYTTPADLPSLQTKSIAAITATTATSGGTISNDGGNAITAKGIVWNTTGGASISSNLGITTDGNGTANFNSSLTGLTPNTTYYVRAYATNGVGTNYGDELNLTTNTGLATVQTNAISSITATSASSGGTISNGGESPITAKGVVWNKAGNPTIASNDGKTTDGTGSANFSSSLASLEPGTKYYVKAYATNSFGTSYGDELNFTTQATVASLSTVVSAAASTTATVGGNITSDGTSPVTARGVVWSTSPNPTIALSTKTTEGTGTGSFSSSITGLTVNTTYYVRAYATNGIGTAYGNELSFTTLAAGAVAIGSQVWMDKNLDVSTYRNGDPIPQVTDINVFKNLTTGAWIYYLNSTDSGARYGKLYNWYAVNDPRGLAPQGWHVATATELANLVQYLGGSDVAGGKMKAISPYWYLGNIGATNSSGFSALPGGELYIGEFGGPSWDSAGYGGSWWTSTETSALYAYWYVLGWSGPGITISGNSEMQKPAALSVRCVKD